MDLVTECGEEEAGQMLTAGLREYNAGLVMEFGKKASASRRTP